MNNLFDKKPKKSLKPSQRHLSLGIPTNIAAGPLGFRAELDIGPKGKRDRLSRFRSNLSNLTVTQAEDGTRASQIVYQDKEREGQGLPAPGTPTTGSVVGGDELGNGPTSECSSFPLSRPIFIRIPVALPSEETAGGTTKEEGEPVELPMSTCRG